MADSVIGSGLPGHHKWMARASPALERAVGSDAVTDNERLEKMIADHLDFVWRLLRRLGVPDAELDDGVQQTFVVASRRLADIEPAAERTFLYGAAVRVASTTRRTVQRRRESDGQAIEEMEALAQSAEDLADQSRARALLDLILSEMPAELREVMVLADIEELAAPEIASMKQLAVGTVASRLRRAREDFRARLARWQARWKAKGVRP
jgi:RNA polymerase sigma-70 factor, ECF subfamily